MDTTKPILPNMVCASSAIDNRLVLVDRARSDGFMECHDLLNGKQYTIYRLFLTPMPMIPGRFKKHQFDQVAEHLGRALREYPNAVAVNPHPLSIDTIARKLREAIQAKKIYSWRHPSIKEELWNAHIHELVIATETTGSTPRVLIGTNNAVKLNRSQPVGTSTEAKSQSLAPSIKLDATTPTELESICMLLHLKRLIPAPIFLVTGLSPLTIESLENRYDVAIVPLESDPSTFQIIS